MNIIIALFLIISLILPHTMPAKPRISKPPIIGVVPLNTKRIKKVKKANFKKSVGAWIPYWDEKNVQKSFNKNKKILTEISPYWYFVKADGKLSATVKYNLRIIKDSKKEGIKVMPMVSNNFDGARISRIINNPTLRKIHVNELVKKVVNRNLSGIDLDYEGLLPKDRQVYARFIKILATKLHKHGKLLSVTLQAKVKSPGQTNATKAQDWHKLGKYADRLRIMAYDYHWKTSPPGAIAPIYWIENIIRFAKQSIPSKKIILAIGTYGYNWQNGRARPITIAQAKQLSKLKKQPIRRDKKSYEQFLRLKAGKPKIWLQDSGSLKKKLKIVNKYGIGGIFFWRLGDEDPATWKVVEHYLTSR